MNKKVAIIGNGWVGKAMKDLFPEATVYVRSEVAMAEAFEGSEKYPNRLMYGEYTNRKDEINKCDVAFICVPTPNVKYYGEHGEVKADGKLDTSAVEECISWLETPLIVVRSTVNPGDCDRWANKYNKCILFQPEYLGETPQHPLLDTKQTPFLIIGGGHPNDRRYLVNLYTEVYNANVTIRQMSLLEAEIVKLSENRAIAFKVAQCQELYDVCEKAGIDYYEVRDAVYGDDPRFNLWWTFIYPDKRGFNSKCIPKDVYAWCAWAESMGYEPKITRAILEKNKEWIKAGE